MGGTVVHARRGDRDRYRPLQSTLCAGSAPEEVVAALLDLHPFRAVYIADLDAIRGTGDHRTTLEALARRHPQLDLWVDAGVRTPERAAGLLRAGARTVVVGSETLEQAGDLRAIREALPEAAVVFSLDHRGETFIGPAGLDKSPDLWPERVILMTLARVGGSDGPDLAALEATRTRAPTRRIYAAGGVRTAVDLAALAGAGIAGVLLASALHDGRIGKEDIGRLVAGR